MTDDDWNDDVPRAQRPKPPEPEPPVVTDKWEGEEGGISVRARCDHGGELVFTRFTDGVVIYSQRHNLHLGFGGDVGARLIEALAQLVALKP